MATTIGAYSVQLILDASNYIHPSKLAWNETAKLKRILEQARDPAERWRQQIDLINKAYQGGAISAGVQQRLVHSISQQFRNAKVHGESLIKVIRDIHIAILGIQQAARAFAVPVRAFADFEQISAQFNVLTGSSGLTKMLIKDLRQIAATSPLTFRAVTDAARTMMQFGIETKNIVPYAKMLGDITGGNSERFTNLTLAFSQMNAAGRLLGQDLRQMTDAGFNPLKEGVKQTGKEFSELLELQQKGLVSAEMVVGWFKSATDAGGDYHGMLAKINETSAGALARMQSQMELLAITLGESLSPAVIELEKALRDSDKTFSEAAKNIGIIVSGWALIMQFRNQLKLVTLGDEATMLSTGLDLVTSGTISKLEKLGNVFTVFVATLARDRAEIRKGMLEVQEWGRWFLSDKTNKYLDDLRARLNRVKNENKDDKDGLPPPTELDSLKKSFEQQEKYLQLQLSLLQAGIKEGAFMDALLAGHDPAQAQKLENLQNAIDKIHELAKEQEKADEARKKAEEEYQKLQEEALKNATKYFEEQRKRQMDFIKTMNTPLKTFEAGQASGAEYLQQQQLEAYTRRVMTTQQQNNMKPTEDQLLDEAKKQLAALLASNKKEERMIKLLDELVKKDPDIQKIRQ